VCLSWKFYLSRTIKKGVPQGSVLAPILFSIYINNLVCGITPARIHLYADDAIIYTVVHTMNQAIELLQDSFRSLQWSLLSLKLDLNTHKKNYMLFPLSIGLRWCDLKNLTVPCCLALCDECLLTPSSLYLVWIGGLDFLSEEKNTRWYLLLRHC